MTKPDDYTIALNFLSVEEEIPDFTVFRKPRLNPQEACPLEGVRAYSLPIDRDDASRRASYWIGLDQLEGYEEFTVSNSFNRQLVLWILFRSLARQCSQKLASDSYLIPPKSFRKEIQFQMRAHPEGHEQLILQAYYLRAAQGFGFLSDFHFRKANAIPFSRRVQQLSLSLDRNYRRNLDCYVDRFEKISSFLDERWEALSPLRIVGSSESVTLTRDASFLQARRLPSRTFVFRGGRENRSQFNGLREHGPLAGLGSTPRLLFAFREQDRQAARDLAMALRGSRKYQRFSFPGFEAIFKVPLEIHPDPIVLEDFSRSSMEVALARVKSETGLVVPILVMPDDETAYLNHKAVFTHAGIATQVCTLGVIQDENTLKWSVANIALQIFCKAGGNPWKVKSGEESGLIIGISQSHKIRQDSENHTIEKYFAFSILTDSSGLFQKLQVLAQGDDETTYLEELRKNLAEVLRSTTNQFSRVVIHTSFKLKHTEIDAIESVVGDAAKEENQTRFAVVKVNQKARFFGVNRAVNSLVPYEGTIVRLGYGEYLIWFEGIFPDRPTVTKAYAGPTHIYFQRFAEDKSLHDETLLQELMNLSGANWRGFNAKSAPVSVFYCHLVADLVHDFQEKGLPLPVVEDLRPWFL
jgi:hypothetical protein